MTEISHLYHKKQENLTHSTNLLSHITQQCPFPAGRRTSSIRFIAVAVAVDHRRRCPSASSPLPSPSDIAVVVHPQNRRCRCRRRRCPPSPLSSIRDIAFAVAVRHCHRRHRPRPPSCRGRRSFSPLILFDCYVKKLCPRSRRIPMKPH